MDGIPGAVARLVEDLRRAEAKVTELEAIIAGRTTPPTDAEIAAHAAEGGEWGITWATRAESVPAACAQQALQFVQQKDAHDGKWLWHALDARRCPRAWPVAP